VSDLLKGDVHLNCQKQFNEMTDQECANYPYLNFYAAAISACLWNNLPCHKMYGYFPERNQEYEFTIDFFTKLRAQ